MKYRIAFVTGLPNWHFSEFYKKLASHPKIDLTMLFCESLGENVYKEAFGISNLEWGVNLLEGYKYKFLKNYSPFPPTFGKTKLFSHLNFGVWNEIKKGHYHAVIVDIWNDISYWLAALACKVSNTPLLFASDSTILTERAKPKWKRVIKQVLLGRLLFPLASGFLYRTELNRQFYLHYGISEKLLFFYPLSVDYEGLSNRYCELKKERHKLRLRYGIPTNAFVILFVGRLSKEKKLQDLIEGYMKTKAENKALIIVGDGKLRETLQEFVKRRNLQNVYFMGFRPKTEVPNFYALSDLLVLPSDYECHGDVVKEAMCFRLPVVVSDKVGASADLVKHSKNGFVYPCGNIDMLTFYIDELSDKAKREQFGEMASEEVKKWDHSVAINGLINALDFIYRRVNNG